MTLTDFLLARIAEDEVMAKSVEADLKQESVARGHRSSPSRSERRQ